MAAAAGTEVSGAAAVAGGAAAPAAAVRAVRAGGGAGRPTRWLRVERAGGAVALEIVRYRRVLHRLIFQNQQDSQWHYMLVLNIFIK